MNRTWFGFGVREPAIAEGFGARLDGQVPVRATVGSSRVARRSETKRAWWMPVVRVLRNAFIAVVAMTVVPLAVVTVRGDYIARQLVGGNMNVRERVMLVAQPVRGFAVARDPSITPLQAGIALNALQYRHPESGEFPVNKPVAVFDRPWRVNAVAPDMFVSSRPDNMYDGPSSRYILEASVKGFSPRELAYLKEIAVAPIWREFDLVARAPAVDIVGGQLRLPFASDALPEMRPMPSYRDSKELAYVAVSRAAYYMAVGQPGKAEEVLRSIVSFGFALIDNGTTTMDELIGTVDVGIGRDALRRFYVIEHDPRANLPQLAALTSRSFQARRAPMPGRPTSGALRRQLLATLADPAAPRPERFEAVSQLTLLQCTSARGMLFGQPDDVRDAIERAGGSLARYPSERALVELGTRLPSAEWMSRMIRPGQSLYVSPAIVAGAVLQNPRLGACTLLLSGGQ
jgi:hypothetical protein